MIESNYVWEGIIIGGAGGAIAGITVWLIDTISKKIKTSQHKQRVYNWLISNTEDLDGKRYRSTRTISSYNNITEDRVRYICSIHEKIYLSTGEQEDMWGVYGIGGRQL